MKLLEIAEYLQQKLIENGFIVHRYDAYSTNSIYLKLDWGVCNSIRISDHCGYSHLSYKYEVNKIYKHSHWKRDNKNFWRYRCPTTKVELDKLIEIILKDKSYKRCFNDYEKLVLTYKESSKNCKGFWEKAKEVVLNVDK